MNSILANVIINQLQARRYNLEWTQFHSMQADVGEPIEVTIGNTDYAVIPFQSYTTVVGFVVLDDIHTFYEVGKYSRTTSKQVTRFCNENNLKKVFIEKRYH